MAIDRKLLATDKLLRDPNGRAPLNVTLKLLHKEYEFGAIRGKYLAYTRDGLDALHEELCREFGIEDIRRYVAQITGQNLDRGQMAAHTAKEKAASQLPSERLVELNWGDGRLQSPDLYQSPQKTDRIRSSGISLLCDWQALPDWPEVMVVENHDTLLQLDRYQLDEETRALPAFYRGHDRQARNLKHYLEAHPDTQVVLFADLDPKGLALAMDFHAKSLLAPPVSRWAEARVDHDAWRRQIADQRRLEAKAQGGLYRLWRELEAQSAAVMQQQWLHVDASLTRFDTGLHR
ncbi:hypothetical protein [Ferrimonas balearica]|uniref:DUF7281 domain-containing protein n=1 Tax=Ferrimonas balearica TaxID=44012 RepID=UPI001C98E81E|nr:hypothetical protein [Ferrimonas balearica]MBY5991301.1 hypothetical protein [Ferrimonas balearica]